MQRRSVPDRGVFFHTPKGQRLGALGLYLSASLLAVAACSSSKGNEETTKPVVPDAGTLHFGDGSIVTHHDGGGHGFDVFAAPALFGCESDANCSGDQHCDTRAGSITQGECVTCLSSSQCQNNQVCDPAGGECVFDCRLPGSPTCGATGLPYCDKNSGACVACQSSSDCQGASTGSICNTVNSACVECSQGSDCTDPNASGCSNGQCGRCLSTSDCGSGQSCTQFDGTGTGFSPGQCQCTGNAGCGSTQPVCLRGMSQLDVSGTGCGCTKASDCTDGYKCDSVVTHECQPPCKTDDDCTNSSLPACNTSTGACVECLSSNDCDDEGPCLTTTNTCVECLSDDDCEDAVCMTSTHTCVQCVSNSNCQNQDGTNVCGPMNTCVACATDSDCVGSPLGPVCQYQTCGCHTTNDCTDDLGAVDAGNSTCIPVAFVDAGSCQ